MFPTSFYFGAVYTEGIFFLMIVSAFYLFEKNKVWQTSLIGATVSATRFVGIFLAPSLISFKKRKSLTPLFVIPLGLVFYMLFLKIEFNNPLYFLNAQSIWGQERSTTQIILLPQVFWRYLKILATTNGLLLINASFELVATVFALLILFFGRKLIRLEWMIFSLLIILTPTFTGTLASMPRYIIVAFPIYIVLAKINSFKIKIGILFVFIILLAIATSLFSRGYWVT